MKMRVNLSFWMILAVVLVSSVGQAQTNTRGTGASELSPFLGRWVGQFEECKASDCESRTVKVTIALEKDQPIITVTFGPADAGINRYSKGTKGPITTRYSGQVEKQTEGTTLSYTAKSGTKVVFQLQGNKLIGRGTGGRFAVNYRLQKEES